jgi:hypothetical protein
MTNEYGPPLNVKRGGGTLSRPDIATCPKCKGVMIPGCDEDQSGRLRGDGTWFCTSDDCDYVYEKP